jgi:molecular chaperone DnaK (HSP70)
MTYNLGVDLGTTFVAAAVARASGVETFALGERGVIAPALVAVGADGGVVTGEAAELRAGAVAGGHLKRRLDDPDPVVLAPIPLHATTLLGAQLRDVVRKVADLEGAPPERVALSFPARWGPARRRLFAEVASVAGIPAPVMVTEAEAAVHHALSGRLADGGVVAVYDLGGGTFDATLVRRQDDRLEVLGTPDGVDAFGGVELDDAVLSYVDSALGGVLAGLDRDDPRTALALSRLRQDCVLAKEALSWDTETVVPVVLPGVHREVRLTRAALEVIVRVPLETTIAALVRAAGSAGLAPADVRSVLLLGGSSRMPSVAKLVSRTFGWATVVADVHPKHVVALGAAALALDAAPVRVERPPAPVVPPVPVLAAPAPVPVLRRSVPPPVPRGSVPPPAPRRRSRRRSRSVGVWLAVLVALAALAVVSVTIPARSAMHPVAPAPSSAVPVADPGATTGAPGAGRQVRFRPRPQDGSPSGR